MQQIPKIIHQIWSDKYRPLPKLSRILGETWKEHHPDWEYRFWDEERMNSFIHEHYPQYRDVYERFQYDVQRWDAIRYLILDKIGGMYVDFDIECLKPHDPLFEGKTCCFSAEPMAHKVPFDKYNDFNNALMACTPEHPFMKRIIDRVFSYVLPTTLFLNGHLRFLEVLNTTGPWVLVYTYEKYPDKNQVYLIPRKFVSPYCKREVKQIRQGYESEELDKRLKDTYSVHYFLGEWLL